MPRLTIAALINADTGLGASGWARGSQACSGTTQSAREVVELDRDEAMRLLASVARVHIRRGDCVSVPPARLSIVARLWPMPKACLADTDADRAESPMPNVGCVTTRKIRLVRGPTAAFRVDRLVATRAPSRL